MSSLALLWAALGAGVPADVPFVYPMPYTSALCTSILAGSLLTTCSGRHRLSRAWSAATFFVAILVLLDVVLHWSNPEGEFISSSRWFSHLQTALPSAVSFLIGATAVWAVAADRPSPHRAVFGAIAGTIAATLGLCGLLNGLFRFLPANAAFEGEVAVDAAASIICLGVAIFCLASSRGLQSREPVRWVAPLLVAALGTVGSFLMWRFLLEERSKAIAFQTSNAATTVRRTLDLELRQLVRQLHQTADRPDAAEFQETGMQPEAAVVWADSRTLPSDLAYLRQAIPGSGSGAPYAVVMGPKGFPELAISAPKREGGFRIVAFRLHEFFDPVLTSVVGPNFNVSLARDGRVIYRYPPASAATRAAAEAVTDLRDFRATMRLEPRSDFVRHGGTASLHLALIMGLNASFLLAFSVYLLHASRARLAEVQEARAGLELEVEQRRNAEAELDRKAKLLQASNTELQEFAHVVSHDLQEPLRSIRGFAQLLARRYQRQLDEDAHEFLGFITDSSVRMNGMIQGLLAYSRVTHTDDHEETFPLWEAVDWAKGNLAMAIEDSGATVEAGDLPHVKGNRLQFCQLMQNLIGNAIKYRGAEKPVIRVTWKKGADCVVTVSDNGLGIGPEFQDRIFGLFKRAHGKDFPGAGVGLALCKKIVERHGGRIWVESTLGRGSQFHIQLPAAASPSMQSMTTTQGGFSSSR